MLNADGLYQYIRNNSSEMIKNHLRSETYTQDVLNEALRLACKWQEESAAAWLISAGAKPVLSCWGYGVGIDRLLFKHGFYVPSRLTMACVNKNYLFINLYLSLGAEPTQHDLNCLLETANPSKQLTETIKSFVLDHNVELTPDHFYWPIHETNKDVVEFFLSQGALPNPVQMIELFTSRTKARNELADLCIAHGATLPDNAVALAANAGRKEAVISLLEQGYSPVPAIVGMDVYRSDIAEIIQAELDKLPESGLPQYKEYRLNKVLQNPKLPQLSKGDRPIPDKTNTELELLKRLKGYLKQ